MPYFAIFKNISTEKIKANADKGYFQECVEMGFRYLHGSDGCNKSVTTTLEYLEGIVNAKSAAYQAEATKLYTGALLTAYLEGTGDNESAAKYLDKGFQYLTTIIQQNVKFKISSSEEQLNNEAWKDETVKIIKAQLPVDESLDLKTISNSC